MEIPVVNTASPLAPPRRHVLPWIFLALFGVLVLAAVVRGTWATATPRNPSSSTEGVSSQLYLDSSGRKQVRCAMVLDFGIEQVWHTVTDYAHFKDIFPMLSASESTPISGDKHKLKATVSSRLGHWTFDIEITHRESPQERVASWDQPGGDLRVNRGCWALTPLGSDKTRVVYTLETEVRPFPVFLVRNALLLQQKSAVLAVNAWLQKQYAR